MNREDRPSIPDELRDRLAEESPDERAELEQVWRMLGEAELSYDDAPPADDTWSAVNSRVGVHRDGRPSRPPRRRRNRRLWGGIAAGLLVLMLAGVLFWRQPITVTAPPGAHVTATLPDGSSVELNSETTLSYPRRFSTWPFVPADARVVRLRGEAFFDVQRGERPFVVETFNARVEVLGTRFNVRARSGDGPGETRVTLASGQVRVRAARHFERAVVLSEAGQASRVAAAASPTTPQDVGVDRALAWRRQGFAVSDWPLSAIFAELERRYDLTITVQQPDVLTDSMTLYYSQQTDANVILHDIAVAQGLTYRATSRGFVVASE